jgi:hypothetical protein
MFVPPRWKRLIKRDLDALLHVLQMCLESFEYTGADSIKNALSGHKDTPAEIKKRLMTRWEI